MLKKRLAAFFLCGALFAGLAAAPVGAETTSAQTSGYTLPEDRPVYSDTALLVNLGSRIEQDTVLYAREADTVRAPGAMVRFMVVAYALSRIQELGLDMDTATGTYTLEMFNGYVAGTGVPTANMQFGETWTLRDLMAASFLQSASDAVTTLAFAIDGGVKEYVKGMNKLADTLGCDYTHFGNVTGLD